jgi:phosphonate transport system ATP-binding protein
MDALRRINREYGITVLCNLHSLDIARSYCDRLVGMSAGKIVFRGTPSMLTEMAARDLYGMEAADVIDADEQQDEPLPMPVPQSAEAVLRQLSA